VGGAFFVGGDFSSLLMTCSRRTCTDVRVPNVTSITGFSGTGNDDVWAVGGSGVLHFDGTSWSKVAGISGASAIKAIAKNDVWAVVSSDDWGWGSDKVAHFNGSTWTVSTVKAPGLLTLFTVDASGPNDVWFGNQTIPKEMRPIGNPPSLAHWDGRTFTTMNPEPFRSDTPTADVDKLFVRSATDIWAVAKLSSSRLGNQVVHFDGKTWTDVTPSDPDSNHYYWFSDISVVDGKIVFGGTLTNSVNYTYIPALLTRENGMWQSLSAPSGANASIDTLAARDGSLWVAGGRSSNEPFLAVRGS
jgi:hypothetical protein